MSDLPPRALTTATRPCARPCGAPVALAVTGNATQPRNPSGFPDFACPHGFRGHAPTVAFRWNEKSRNEGCTWGFTWLTTPLPRVSPARATPPSGRCSTRRCAKGRAGHPRRDPRRRRAVVRHGGRRRHGHVPPRGHGDRFRIGSITKTFTATVLLRLVAEGRLTLEDTVERWLPGMVTGNGHDGSAVTVRRLLDHTSGIHSHTNDQPALSRQASYTPGELVAIALSHPADFPAGTGWAYSNTNYVLAGLIVERVTGRGWPRRSPTASSARWA
ncbi:serine hydrolase domain-containing protein [Streptomyces zhihengii]